MAGARPCGGHAMDTASAPAAGWERVDVGQAALAVRLMWTASCGPDASVGRSAFMALPWVSSDRRLATTLQDAFGLELLAELGSSSIFDVWARPGLREKEPGGTAVVALCVGTSVQEWLREAAFPQAPWDAAVISAALATAASSSEAQADCGDGGDGGYVLPDKENPPTRPQVLHSIANLVVPALSEITRLVAGSASVLIVGHSLGGAAAMLVADALVTSSFQDSPPVALVAGCPAVGDAAFSARWAAEVAPRLSGECHLVHVRDSVPRLPPQGVEAGTEEVEGSECHLGSPAAGLQCPCYVHTAGCRWQIDDDGRAPATIALGGLPAARPAQLPTLLEEGLGSHGVATYAAALAARFESLDLKKASRAIRLMQTARCCGQGSWR
eukprot:CAMPEP_0180415654 /NCGR_PEP_ID=MMETSP1036_2-20121128/32_1 /TAXON_ID=632150 /ORGANISM="Azadinium spinosum, Strain 3D9" /LENGTH=384 /DNA_ID=CAMNT_0022420465 /DNA_START=14 /DNA_END=1165 /DNA_ORIENTATION=+